MICARSSHADGVNVILLDGSVGFLKKRINVRIYAALGTNADAEVINADSF